MQAVRHTAVVLAVLLFAAGMSQAAIYEIGPGKTYETIGAFAWEDLAAGDTVKIYYKATAYAEKFCVGVVGTAQSPVVIQGVPGEGGELPIIDGENATTRTELDYAGDERSVIHFGGTATPDVLTTKYVTLENLVIKNARSSMSYTCDGGTTKYYLGNAAPVRLVYAENITLNNLEMTNAHNGFITSPTTADVTVKGCYLWGNGDDGNTGVHQNYTECNHITFEYNHFGLLATSADGNGLKDRSSYSIIRYNWIEDGARQLDLVDSADATIKGDADYGNDFVYGNILIEQADPGISQNQIVHYGGDSAQTSNYRPGPLHFYNNTVISYRDDANMALFRPQDDEVIDAYNNIVHCTDASYKVDVNAVTNGSITIANNWFTTGYDDSNTTDGGNNIDGSAPGFLNLGTEDFHLASDSDCVDAGRSIKAGDFAVTLQYVKHQDTEARPSDATMDMGAFEYDSGGPPPDLVITTTSLPGGVVSTAYSETVSATGGETPYSWSVISGSLPSGLDLGSSTGVISGTPTSAGTSNFTVQVTDSQGTPDTDTQALSIEIVADLDITTTSLPDGTKQQSYSQTLAATGGETPYTWSLVSGALPNGLSLSSGGVISGTCRRAGTFNFTVRVTDSQDPADTDDQALSITVNN